MDAAKRLRAVKRGMKVLSERITRVREGIYPAEKAFVALAGLKHKLELEIVPVQLIPIGMTRQKLEKERKVLDDKIENLSNAEAEAMMEELQARLSKKEVS